ncbi:winged helix-turn-helix transcriptional regulator [Sphingomonas morindae]|uniref:Helix-turn-helix transcriptional regulator n=1 Tax=Sphingomonas morindae TaxID=1541170 RepID=A0ABY4XD35_9SPHN|nr:helix-turn-helix domain-containing protein [Sphingomonas morindae]USI74661.1 helix-turn-helix transcriptional regulator [Sphingomonas morindae]
MDRYAQLRTCKRVGRLEDIVPTDVDPVFFADCAARSFFDQVANKWAVMILTLLSDRPARFNEMRRRLEGVTHKALTQALRRLERNGLIARQVLATSPVAVEYSITPLGKTLQVPFGAVYDWSIEHLDDLEAARQAYDARQADAR